MLPLGQLQGVLVLPRVDRDQGLVGGCLATLPSFQADPLGLQGREMGIAGPGEIQVLHGQGGLDQDLALAVHHQAGGAGRLGGPILVGVERHAGDGVQEHLVQVDGLAQEDQAAALLSQGGEQGRLLCQLRAQDLRRAQIPCQGNGLLADAVGAVDARRAAQGVDRRLA